MYVDWKRNESYTVNFAFGKDFGELLSGRAYEQTFVAEGRAIERVSVLLETFGRDNSGDVTLKIVGTDGRTLVESRKSVATFQNAGWQDFAIEGAPVLNKSVYKIRLTAPLANAGNAISWIASPYDTYPQGVAIVDGIAQNADFSFRVGFAR